MSAPPSWLFAAIMPIDDCLILAWTVTERFDPSNTCQVLLAAGKHLVTAGRPLLYADSGVENVNRAVDSILLTACLDRILAGSGRQETLGPDSICG